MVEEEEEEKADTNNAVTRTLRGPSWSANQDVEACREARREARASFNYRATERAAIQGYA